MSNVIDIRTLVGLTVQPCSKRIIRAAGRFLRPVCYQYTTARNKVRQALYRWSQRVLACHYDICEAVEQGKAAQARANAVYFNERRNAVRAFYEECQGADAELNAHWYMRQAVLARANAATGLPV
jgi:hypothetical protein